LLFVFFALGYFDFLCFGHFVWLFYLQFREGTMLLIGHWLVGLRYHLRGRQFLDLVKSEVVWNLLALLGVAAFGVSDRIYRRYRAAFVHVCSLIFGCYQVGFDTSQVFAANSMMLQYFSFLGLTQLVLLVHSFRVELRRLVPHFQDVLLVVEPVTDLE
jgi:hypothetical protein